MPLPADPTAAYALLTDPDYVQAVGEATGGQDVVVTVTRTDDGGAVVSSRRVLPAELPSYAKAVVGDSLKLTETRTFGPAAGDGSRSGTAQVSFEGAPVSISGPLELVPAPGGSELVLDAKVAASIPFVGGKIEKFAAEQIERFMRKEGELAADRLNG
jgi:hypothetical protein